MIKLFSEEIKKDPKNAELYFKRAAQHRYAGHFEKSLIDYKKARTLDTEYQLVDLGIGFIFYDKGWNKTAEIYFKSFLKQTPGHTVAMAALARALKSQNI